MYVIMEYIVQIEDQISTYLCFKYIYKVAECAKSEAV